MPCLRGALTYCATRYVGIVYFRAQVLAQLVGFRQSNRTALEAGGLLLGHRRYPHLEVTQITVPASMDVRLRGLFVRQDPTHRSVATTRWRKSKRRVDVLGEWHTHPEKASPC